MPKNTADSIALILAVVVGLTVLATAGAILYISITQPGRDLTRSADAIGRIIAVLVGALVGYMAGRKINGNGNHK